MDPEALRIRELVVEAGAMVDWLASGRGDVEIVGAALLYLRDELSMLADHTADSEACSAACGMIDEIQAALAGPTTTAWTDAA